MIVCVIGTLGVAELTQGLTISTPLPITIDAALAERPARIKGDKNPRNVISLGTNERHALYIGRVLSDISEPTIAPVPPIRAIFNRVAALILTVVRVRTWKYLILYARFRITRAIIRGWYESADTRELAGSAYASPPLYFRSCRPEIFPRM